MTLTNHNLSEVNCLILSISGGKGVFLLLDDGLTKPNVVPFYRNLASQFMRDTWRLRRGQKHLRNLADRSKCT